MTADGALHPVPGELFGGYEIIAELGHGGMGHVFRARHLTLDRQVALKVLGNGLSGDAAYRQRFLAEARSAARLNHRNIVQIYDFGQCGPTSFLAMEFVPGQNLGAVLRSRGRLPEAEAVGLCRQAATALGVAHAAGLVHRDVKPDNLILRDDGVLKLVDLGLAKSLADDQGLTLTGVVAGTPHYISPEQIEGRRDIDPRADVYSLGATLFHLVTGHTPHEGSSPMVVIAKHLNDPPRDPRSFEPALSDALCAVILRMMARHRDGRYPDMAAVDRELARLESGEAVEERTAAGLASTVVVGSDLPGDATVEVGSRLDSAGLERLERLLAEAIGPLARVLVRRSAATSPDLVELSRALAGQIPSEAARERFLAAAAESAAASGSRVSSSAVRAADSGETAAATASAAAGPVQSEWDPVALQALESRLAAAIGPVARVLVTRTARRSGSWRGLVDALAANLPDHEQQLAFRREFEQPPSA